ncbi:DUF488 domain-containing protein [Sporosarcina contaminans]|uniref:DUF488 domain-containing protein n=1 Tax=Sporosarcina contaminans TaxID=633403 RepID=A0ABW3TWR1_9BACL
MIVKLKRAYERASEEDGVRVLVDRVWPRGVSKEEIRIDHWMKEIAPSIELRKWFSHDPGKFDEFVHNYKKELSAGKQQEQLKKLQGIVEENRCVTLVYGAKDEKYNQAIVLKELLDEQWT